MRDSSDEGAACPSCGSKLIFFFGPQPEGLRICPSCKLPGGFLKGAGGFRRYRTERFSFGGKEFGSLEELFDEIRTRLPRDQAELVMARLARAHRRENSLPAGLIRLLVSLIFLALLAWLVKRASGAATADVGGQDVLTRCHQTPRISDAGLLVTVEERPPLKQMAVKVFGPRSWEPGRPFLDPLKAAAARRIGGDGPKASGLRLEGRGVRLAIDIRAPKGKHYDAALTLKIDAARGPETVPLACDAFDWHVRSRSSCETQGGRWSAQPPQCDFPSIDAGAPCSDVAQCESVCVAAGAAADGAKAEGRCYAFTSLIGTCLKWVKKGIMQPKVCVD